VISLSLDAADLLMAAATLVCAGLAAWALHLHAVAKAKAGPAAALKKLAKISRSRLAELEKIRPIAQETPNLERRLKEVGRQLRSAFKTIDELNAEIDCLRTDVSELKEVVLWLEQETKQPAIRDRSALKSIPPTEWSAAELEDAIRELDEQIEELEAMDKAEKPPASPPNGGRPGGGLK